MSNGQYANSFCGANSTGFNDFYVALIQSQGLPYQSDINLNGHNVVNSADQPLIIDGNTLVNADWVQNYAQFQPGQLRPLNQINQFLPLDGTLNLAQNNQQTLVNDCIVQNGSKQAVNSETLFIVQETLQTNIQDVQDNLDLASSTLQTQINTLNSRTLDQVPIAQNTVNLNQQSLDNVAGIKQNNTPYLQFDTTPQQIKTFKPLIRQGTYPSVPVDQNQYITLADYQNLAPVTPISQFQPPISQGSSSRPVMVDINGLQLIQSNRDVAFQDELTAFVTQQYVDQQDALLQLQIDATQTSLSQTNLDLQSEITNRTNADSNLQTQITNEVNARTNADSNLQTNINVVASNLATETTNRTNADSNLQTQITNDVNNLANNYYTKTEANNNYLAITESINQISDLNATNGALDLNDNLIINLQNPINDQDAATKFYVDNNTGSSMPQNATLNYISTTNPTSGNVDMNNNKLVNLANPVNQQDAVTLNYYQNNIPQSGLPSNSTLNYIATTNPTSANVPLNNFKLTGLTQGSQAGDSIEFSQLQTTNTNLSNLTNNVTNNYVSNSSLASQLANYVLTTFLTTNYQNNTQLTSTLSSYVTNSSLASQLANYITSTFLTANYYNQTQVNTLLSSYVTNSSLSSQLANYVLSSFLTSNYYNQTQTNTLLNSYVTNTSLASQLANYLLTSTFNSTIANYSTTTQMNSAISGAITTNNTNYYDKTTVDGFTLNKWLAPTSSVSFGSQKLINIADPTLSQDGVTLNYLQTNNYTKTQSDANYMQKTLRLDQIQTNNPITSQTLDLFTGVTGKINIPTITDTLSPNYGRQAMNLDYYNSLQKIVEFIYLTTTTLPTSNAITTGWAIQQQQTSTSALIVFSANQVTLKANNTYKISMRAQSITANNNNANAVYQIQTSAGSALVSANSSTLSLSPATSNLQTNLGGNLEFLYAPVSDTIIRCFCTNLSGVLSVNIDWNIQLMPTSYAVAVSPSLVNTQVFSQIYTTFTNNANFQILHNLALPLDQLNVQVYIRFKANTAGWTTSDWLQVWNLDRIALSTDCGGCQLTTDSSNPNNAFLICFANNGQGVISKVGQNYTNYNTSLFDVKVVCSSIGQYVVSSQAFQTSVLSVNSNVDFGNAYKIVNLPLATNSGDAISKQYLDNQSYLTQTSGDARYYLQTTTLNNITQANGTVNLGGQKITGSASPTVGSDLTTLTYLQNYIYSKIENSAATGYVRVQTQPLIYSSGAQNFFAGDSYTQSGNNTNFVFNSGAQSNLIPTNVEFGTFFWDNRTSIVAGTNTRYAVGIQSCSLSNLARFNGNCLYLNGYQRIDPNTAVGQNNTTSVLLSVNGSIQCYQLNQTGPSLRQLKQNIRDFDYGDLLEITPRTYEFDQKACEEAGIGYDDRKNINGFILDEVPEKYRSEDGIHLKRSQLETDLLYMLVQENKTLKSRVSIMEQQIQQILQQIQ